MTITVYFSPDGTEYDALPRTWRNATNITERWALSHGWTRDTREVPDPGPEVQRYSQYRLHRALDEAGIWDVLWSSLSDSQRQYWNEAQDLASDDDLFRAALSGIELAINTGAIVLPEGVTVESILESARG